MGKLAKSAMERESVSGSITKGAGGLAPVASSGCVCASPSGIARRLLPSLRPSRLHCAAAGLGQPIAVAMAAVCGRGGSAGCPRRSIPRLPPSSSPPAPSDTLRPRHGQSRTVDLAPVGLDRAVPAGGGEVEEEEVEDGAEQLRAGRPPAAPGRAGRAAGR